MVILRNFVRGSRGVKTVFSSGLTILIMNVVANVFIVKTAIIKALVKSVLNIQDNLKLKI